MFFSWTFDLLFIISSTDIYCLEFMSHHIEEILYVNVNSKGNQSWKRNKEIQIFTCFWWRVKILYQRFIFFLSFMSTFRSSSSQMFFKIKKIGALKNSTTFWIKRSLPHRCFLVNIAKFLRTAFLQNFSGDCFCNFFKTIK